MVAPTIINKTIPKTPKFVYTQKPTFRTDLERERFWAIERERWVEGYGGLKGMHYFYLTQCSIKDGTSGNYIRPYYRDCDEWIINVLHDAFWNCTGAVGLIKRREIGATSIGAGLLPLYTMRMFTGSTFGMTSCDQPRIAKMFGDKTMVALNEIDADIRPSIENKNETKSATYLKLAWKTKKTDGSIGIQYSDLYAKETQNSDEAAKGFSSTRMRAAFFDEMPLSKRKKKLLTSSQPCFMQGSKQTGFLFWAGTCEEGLTNEQIVELQELIEDASLLDTNIVFAPAWWGLIMNEAGESDEKAGIEWVMKKREQYQKMSDTTHLKAFIKNYPLDLNEIFELGSGAAYEDDVSEMLKATAENLRKNPPVIQKTKFVKVGEKIQTAEAKDPIVFMLEQPKQNVDYYQLIDGTGTGTVTGNEDGSDTCGIIAKGFDPQGGSYTPVCVYLERPKRVVDSYNQLVNQFRYYNIHGGVKKICAEGNIGTSDHFSTFLEKEGLGKFIQKRKDLSGKGNVEKNKPFQYIGADEEAYQYRVMNELLRKYGHDIKLLMVIMDLLKPKSTNADIRSAFNMLAIALPIDYDKPIVHKKPISQGRLVMVINNGQTEWKWQGDQTQQQIRGIAEQLQQ